MIPPFLYHVTLTWSTGCRACRERRSGRSAGAIPSRLRKRSCPAASGGAPTLTQTRELHQRCRGALSHPSHARKLSPTLCWVREQVEGNGATHEAIARS